MTEDPRLSRPALIAVRVGDLQSVNVTWPKRWANLRLFIGICT